MSAMVKVSVIIPVYNVAPYLGECLDSVIQQSLTDIEIIVLMIALRMIACSYYKNMQFLIPGFAYFVTIK